MVKVSNLGKITQEQKTEENLLKLIGEKNPNLDMKKLELDYTNNKTFLIPKPGSKGYKNKVEIRFDTLTNQDLQVIEKVKSI
ncbi:hypothetical protein JIY74_30295 [Vibrio harveyi]|nr:hypothetical protein [Vibrio harveyi]